MVRLIEWVLAAVIRLRPEPCAPRGRVSGTSGLRPASTRPVSRPPFFFFSQREDFGWKERERENNKTSTGPRNVASSFKGGASSLLVRERRRFFFREEHQTCQISRECVIYPGLSLVSDCVFSYTYAVLRIESNLLTLPFLHKCQGFTARTCSCTK